MNLHVSLKKIIHIAWRYRILLIIIAMAISLAACQQPAPGAGGVSPGC